MDELESQRTRALTEALSWSAIVALQRDRLAETEAWIATEHDAGRHVAGTDDLTRMTFVRLRADRHFLLVAARNLMRALDTVGLEGTLTLDGADHVLVLRNCLEHWDEPNGRSATKFARLFPSGDPNSYRWGVDGTRFGELDLDKLVRSVASLRAQLLAMEQNGWVWRRASE